LSALHRGYLIGAASRWRVAIMRPGSVPLGALANALSDRDVLDCASKEELQRQIESTSFGLVNAVRGAHLQPGESLLILVDQFEELFRFARGNRSPMEDAEASLFVSLLLRATEELSSMVRRGPIRWLDLAPPSNHSLPHFCWFRFSPPGGSGAWRPGVWGAVRRNGRRGGENRRARRRSWTQRFFLPSTVRRKRNDSVPVSIM
jgi:hypothetical protein